MPQRVTSWICAAEIVRLGDDPRRRSPRSKELRSRIEREPALSLLMSGLMTKIAETLCDWAGTKEALSHAQQAIRLGRACDQFDWQQGCGWRRCVRPALGRIEAARTTIAEADAILRSSECQLERRNLAATARKLGITLDSVAIAGTASGAAHASAPEPTWLPLSEGKSFLSVDPRFVLQLRRYAASDLPVLIEGETGTGKELVAHLLHELGPWSKGPLVVVDCTTLSESLAEVELFGAARGAYNRSGTNREAWWLRPTTAPCFSTRLTELTTALQAKLLRLLQEGTYRRLGESRERKVRTRVVAATNRNIEAWYARDGSTRPVLPPQRSPSTRASPA